MPYPGGKHAPGHYISGGGGGGAGGDPVGTVLVLQTEGFPGPFGLQQTYTTVNGTIFSLVSLPINPGRGELLSSDIFLMAAVSDNDPPTPPQEINFTSSDAAVWSDDSGDPGSPWNIDVSPSFSGSAFLEVAGLFIIFKNLVAVGNYFTSPDGVVWTQRTGPWGSVSATVQNFMSDGTFDYVALGGDLYRSVDGIAWTLVQAGITAEHCIFAASNAGDKYWLFGNSGASSRVESSLDGSIGSFSRDLVAEASLDAAGLLSFAGSFSVAYANSIGIGTFVLAFNVGISTGSSATRLATSTDGVTWANPGVVFNGNNVRYSGTLGVFVRTAGDATKGALLRSGNGTVWSSDTYAGFGTFAAHPSADLLTMFR